MSENFYLILGAADRWTNEWKPPSTTDLSFQCAVLTWISRLEHGSVPPWQLARMVVSRVKEFVQADSIQGEFWVTQRRGFFRRRRWECASRCEWTRLSSPAVEELESSEQDFPSVILFLRDGEILMQIHTQFWNEIGGPAPYHDSVTLIFWAKQDCRSELRTILEELCPLSGLRERQPPRS